ncbi:hypothetical protein MPF_1310 [Methanohalophilus portucalensis FDF-1]|uniref:Uncharacterized protein n=1 Tax=Methanohalophilus portucalensis FDF-1 TaxID=523843 RepID=A0A1L9C4N7_9EURY|nr:hypothetical protein MPF_1310 [Methanohalophilus portucalensis FDF-1]
MIVIEDSVSYIIVKYIFCFGCLNHRLLISNKNKSIYIT